MNATVTIDRRLLAAGALGCVLAGGAAMLLWHAWTRRPAPAERPAPPPVATTSAATALAASAREASVTLTPEAIGRAGIVVSPAGTAPIDPSIRVPGVVEPNAYRQVVVTPLVAGRVTRIGAELGQHVRRGETLASVYSPELSEARARVRAAEAELDAHDRELKRTEKLAAIGAASRAELERAHAEHAAQVAALDAARARLSLLAGPEARERDTRESASVVDVLAPIDGTVIARTANAGLNVDAAAPLFTIADLSTVWVVADVYEQDLARARVGAAAIVTVPSQPDVRLDGRVAYIDPQIAAATRTAKVRVELPNPGLQLRLGMYVSVSLAGSGARDAGPAAVSMPRGAVQTAGERTVVYVVDPADRQRFIERQVALGAASGERVAVVSGLAPGELVVVEGSFFVRAEIERHGPPQRAHGSAAATPAADTSPQVVPVRVTASGFEPSNIAVRPGVPARLRFTRSEDATCAAEVTVPMLGIRKPLPVGIPVDVAFTPAATDLAFACGMGMFQGTVVVR
jgi:RND family efflux transporter MFP subunit